MKKLIAGVLIAFSGIAFGASHIILEGIHLTETEAQTLYNAVSRHAKMENREATNVTKFTLWLEESKSLINSDVPDELAAIDNAINLVKILGLRGAAQRWVEQPNARMIKQASIDRSVLIAQQEVDQSVAHRDSLILEGAEQSAIDIVTAELTVAEETLTAAQALTIEDFIGPPDMHPVEE